MHLLLPFSPTSYLLWIAGYSHFLIFPEPVASCLLHLHTYMSYLHTLIMQCVQCIFTFILS